MINSIELVNPLELNLEMVNLASVTTLTFIMS